MNPGPSSRSPVPPWHFFEDAVRSRELGLTSLDTRPAAIDPTPFRKVVEANWLERRDMVAAGELVSFSAVFGAEALGKEAAQFIVDNHTRAAPAAVSIALSVLGRDQRPAAPDTSTPDTIRSQIQSHKRRRISEPHNPFVWMDLARLYVLLGQIEPAERAVQIALNSAPYSRFCLRSAARFFMLTGDADRALWILRKDDTAVTDPWLMASEIAIASSVSKPPRYATAGLKLVGKERVSPFDESELTSALASIELGGGNVKRARSFFNLSLRDPNDNALAQATWASEQVRLERVESEVSQRPSAHEAVTIDAEARSDWGASVESAILWTRDEPFQARARMTASSTFSSILREPKKSESLLREGLVIEPGHPGLINNLSFSLALQGKPDAARMELMKADLDKATDLDMLCLLATNGMIEFRSGRAESGRRYYEQSIELAKKKRVLAMAKLSRLHLAREMARAGDQSSRQVFQEEEEGHHPPGFNRKMEAIAESLRAEIDVLLPGGTGTKGP